MPLFNSDIIFLQPSGQVVGQNGNLTLRADNINTGEIIVDSGASLRPERDLAMELGTAASRWSILHTNILEASGAILARRNLGAGFFSNFPTMIVASGAVAIFPGTEFIVSESNTQFLNGQLEINSSVVADVNGSINFSGLTTFATTPKPEADVAYDLGTSVHRWHRVNAGDIVATSGTITNLGATTLTAPTINYTTANGTTLNVGTVNSTASINAFGNFGVLGLATLNGGTFFGNAAAPSFNKSFPMGLRGFEWNTIYSTSGVFESIMPNASGASILMHGHWVPGLDDTYDLGTTDHQWGAVHAVSGVFDSGVRSDQGLAEYQLATGSGTFSGATYVDLEWDTNVIEDSDFYSRSAGIITINRAGLYRVTYGINTGSVGTGRATASARVLLNGSTLVGGSVAYIYSRTTGDDEGTMTKSFLVELSATDTLVVQSHQEDGSAHSFSFLDECNINLEFIR